MASDTKDRICEAALRLFNERGYDAVSLRDVAAEADIAIGSLTYHFAKKEDLLAKMLVDLHSTASPGGRPASLPCSTCPPPRASTRSATRSTSATSTPSRGTPSRCASRA